MPALKEHARGGWLCRGAGLCWGLVWLCLPTTAHGICGLDAAAFDQIRDVEDPAARQAWQKRLAGAGATSCTVCHIASYGPRNQYGNAINMLVTGVDREDSARKRAAGRRVNEIPADPSLPDSPTFGDRIGRGFPPATDLATELPALRNIPVRPPEDVTVEQAEKLVRQVASESRYGTLQLSRTYEIRPDVAAVLAEFEGELLILGLRSLSPDVARALAKSRADTVWLHSVTSLDPEAADALAGMPGNLVLSGLVKLDAVPLAKKLARRPAVLTLPYLKQIGPEVAAALAENPRGLILAALTDLSPDVQEALAKTAGALTLPSLTSLDSLALTEKLAAGYASAVLLPRVKTLSVEQAQVIAAVLRPFFLGGILLPSAVMTEEVATVFANFPGSGALTLGAGVPSDPALKILVESDRSFGLLEAKSFSAEQTRILAAAADKVRGGPVGFQTKIRVSGLTRLDSPLLAETLLRCSADFGAVTTISAEAAAALGRVPEPAAGQWNKELNFPSLEELSPETARLLMNRRWPAITLPALRDPSPETVRSLVRQTSILTLGVTTMTPELAAVFAELASDEQNLGGGLLTLPCLSEMSPEAARVLVQSLNRGAEANPRVPSGLNRAPQLYIGGRGLFGVSPPLTPELAGELANYRGKLSLAGLRTLSPEAAAALAAYRGPYLELYGPATDRLSPEAAAALAALPGNLFMYLRALDSVPLAAKFARQSQRTLDSLESISAEAIPACVTVNGFFTLRQLTTLDSPELAARLIQDSSGQVLPSLRTITPAAAEVLITAPNDVVLGLRSLDDPGLALILAKAKRKVSLPRLRAATPTVMQILSRTPSIDTPPLRSLYVLSDGTGDDFVLP